MTELSAKMSKHFHYNSVMPLSEANLSKHTLQSPPSREAKLKHILVYVDLQRELIALEEQVYSETEKNNNVNNMNNMSDRRTTPSPSSPDANTFATVRSSPLSPTLSLTKDKEKEKEQRSEMASMLHNSTFQHLHHPSKPTPESTPHTALHYTTQQQQQYQNRHQYQQKHLHNHEGQQQQHQQQQQEEASSQPEYTYTHLHEKQLSTRPVSPDLHIATRRNLSPSIMPQQHTHTDVDPYHAQQTQPQNQSHNLIQNNTTFHHYRQGPHPNPLDPSLALPRALPRSMSNQDRPLYRNMFLSDQDTSPPSSPPPQLRSRHAVSPSPINITFEPSTPFKHEIIPGARRTESPVAQSPSPSTPSEKKGRFSRFSFLGRSTSRAQNHKRHESVPATKTDPWCNAKERERAKFSSLTYRSGSRLAGSGSGMEVTGPMEDSRYDHPQQQQRQPQQEQTTPKSKVKRLFQDIFKSSTSSSSKSKKISEHTAREISLPSTYLGQQPESALEGSRQAQCYYNPRHSLVRSSTAVPIPSYPNVKTSPPPHQQEQEQHRSQNNYLTHPYIRPSTSLATYMRESLVDPVQPSPYRTSMSSLEQQHLQSSLYYYPDHQQQHYQNMEQLQQQQQRQKEERRGLLHHHNEDDDDSYMRAYAPLAQASLTPPPASSVLRHSTSSNRIFGLVSDDFDQVNGGGGGGEACRSRPRTRPSSQLIAPVQRADLEGLLRQSPIVVV
ncbi:hypothetical protein BGZ59_005321 [Podila verticillata]|nr:hypothetical protein BGZ59_005321 [Podila verticillata]